MCGSGPEEEDSDDAVIGLAVFLELEAQQPSSADRTSNPTVIMGAQSSCGSMEPDGNQAKQITNALCTNTNSPNNTNTIIAQKINQVGFPKSRLYVALEKEDVVACTEYKEQNPRRVRVCPSTWCPVEKRIKFFGVLGPVVQLGMRAEPEHSIQSQPFPRNDELYLVTNKPTQQSSHELERSHSDYFHSALKQQRYAEHGHLHNIDRRCYYGDKISA